MSTAVLDAEALDVPEGYELVNGELKEMSPMSAKELAIHIVRPGEKADPLLRRVRQLQKSGTKAVWLIFPRQQEIHCYEGKTFRAISVEHTRESNLILPGFKVKVDTILSGDSSGSEKRGPRMISTERLRHCYATLDRTIGPLTESFDVAETVEKLRCF